MTRRSIAFFLYCFTLLLISAYIIDGAYEYAHREIEKVCPKGEFGHWNNRSPEDC